MRIVGGQLGGRVLKAPAGSATRPTSERVREALFAILGPPPDDTRVLDLFAGSGALGLEALSRGAVDATFVDSGRPALAVLKANLAALGVTDRARVVASDVPAFLRRPPAAPWRWVFIDPPYLVREEWERVAQATIDATRAGACVALWYPIKALSRPNGLLARLREAGVPTLALDLITGDLAKKKKALAGSGMVITRPPAGLAGRLAEAAAWLGPVLAAGGEWSLRVQAWDA